MKYYTTCQSAFQVTVRPVSYTHLDVYKRQIYRHKSNGKWFGFFAELSGKPCVILKCEPLEADFLRQAYRGVTPGWHMNKQHWNTVELCSDVPPEEIEKMVQMSFRLTAPKVRSKHRG